MAPDDTPKPAPVLYVTDLTYNAFDPADLFDLAYLLRSPDHDLRGVVLSGEGGDGERVLDALTVRARKDVPCFADAKGLIEALKAQAEPVNLIVVGGYGIVAEVLARDRTLFREKAARLFLAGGYVNDYSPAPGGTTRLPIDPRLQERNPERFDPSGDPRAVGDQAAFGHLLTSGEGVIWLPRDVCLWRYSAPGVLSDGGPVAEFLLRELFFTNLAAGDRYDAADAPALLSALPAFLLAVRPDPFVWMRLFRAMTARVAVNAEGFLTSFVTRADTPNLYCVVAIDGYALGKLLTPRLRDRPLVAEGDI